jgi:hypothetical protein
MPDFGISLLQYVHKKAQNAWPDLSLERLLEELEQVISGSRGRVLSNDWVVRDENRFYQAEPGGNMCCASPRTEL